MLILPYNPSERVAGILNWTLAKVKELPYKVPLRWAFYRCVQELGLGKDQYKNFKQWTTRARKRMWNGWMPYTLVDDTRPIYMRGDGFDSFDDWLKTIRDQKPQYPKFDNQENLIIVGYEARAMHRQFEHYTKPYHIPLAPFGGDPGPDFKWRVAQRFNALAKGYPDKPIILLYFGDYEPIQNTGSMGKGIRIPLDALRDIKPWLHAMQRAWRPEQEGVVEKLVRELRFVRCGLNREHIERYDIPENPDRPGEYQWEALSDKDAKELILGSIEKFWDREAIQEVEDKETEDQEEWKEIFDKMMRDRSGPSGN